MRPRLVGSNHPKNISGLQNSVLVGCDSDAPTQIYRQNASAHRGPDHNVRILACRDIRLVVYA